MEDTVIRFWEGSCGIVLEPRKRNDGDYFWTYRFTRAYKPEGSDRWRYSTTFDEKHDQSIATLMSRAIQFREQNDATDWICSQMAKSELKAA